MRKAQFNNAQLQGANLIGAQLQGAYLYSAQLQGANLGSTQLQGADLGGAQLQGANLSRAQLQGANLLDAKLEGAIFNNLTRIVGIQHPSKENVFNISSFLNDTTRGIFDKTEIYSNTSANLIAIAKEIPNKEHFWDEGLRDNYIANIKQAKPHPSFNAEKYWAHTPTIAAKTLIMICNAENNFYGTGFLKDTSRLAAAQGIYNNYAIMGIPFNPMFEGTHKVKDLIKDIDKTLCTHESCKDLRDGIKGLDCKTVTK